jgi:hypothetical protein
MIPPGRGLGGGFHVPRLARVRLATGEDMDPDLREARAWTWRDERGDVWGHAGRVDGRRWIRLPGVATFLFADRGDATALVEPGWPPAHIDDVYWRDVLPVALQALGTEVLHASAVRFPRGVVAFCGRSGTGKSTLAFGLARRGYPLWADDAVAFEVAARAARSMPLPFQPRLRPASAAFFGLSRDEAPSAAASRPITDPAVDAAPLAALWVVRRGAPVGAEVFPRIRRLRAAEAFTAVLAHAFCFDFEDERHKRQMLRRYLDLTACVPVFRIALPEGLSRLPVVLDHSVATVGAVDVVS